ncbi:BPSL1445 family SYLF domain-containing lipoprotein [Allopusillimonas soli]|nr:YSC84-related protein [Allopusillimonas soli]
MKSRKLIAAVALGVATLAFSGCTTTFPQGGEKTIAEKHATIDSRADNVLNRLYEASPDAKSAVAKAKGVLIFPKIMSGGLVVGLEHGDGVLRVNGQNQGYYTTASGSIGLQAGVQSRAMVLLFMTQEALDDFRNSEEGWTVGAGATVAVAKIGANGLIDSDTLTKPVVAFVMTNAGLAAGVSLKGTKITKMEEGQ